MRTKRVVLVTLLLLLTVLFAATGCDAGVRVGALQTETQTVELENAGPVNVEITMGAGELDVSDGASELLEASFTYNVEELDPQATYNNGRLVVRDQDVDEGIGSLLDVDEFRNEWDLKFNEDTPMEMTVDLGAGRSNLTLGGLALTNLTIHGGAGDVVLDLSGSQALRQLDFDIGAGETTIDLSGPWQEDLDARISGGLGAFSLRLPADVGVMVDVETGVGAVDANGLTRDGNTYTNDVYGVSEVTLRIDIEGGVGKITLDVE